MIGGSNPPLSASRRSIPSRTTPLPHFRQGRRFWLRPTRMTVRAQVRRLAAGRGQGLMDIVYKSARRIVTRRRKSPGGIWKTARSVLSPSTAAVSSTPTCRAHEARPRSAIRGRVRTIGLSTERDQSTLESALSGNDGRPQVGGASSVAGRSRSRPGRCGASWVGRRGGGSACWFGFGGGRPRHGGRPWRPARCRVATGHRFAGVGVSTPAASRPASHKR